MVQHIPLPCEQNKNIHIQLYAYNVHQLQASIYMYTLYIKKVILFYLNSIYFIFLLLSVHASIITYMVVYTTNHRSPVILFSFYDLQMCDIFAKLLTDNTIISSD